MHRPAPSREVDATASNHTHPRHSATRPPRGPKFGRWIGASYAPSKFCKFEGAIPWPSLARLRRRSGRRSASASGPAPRCGGLRPAGVRVAPVATTPPKPHAGTAPARAGSLLWLLRKRKYPVGVSRVAQGMASPVKRNRHGDPRCPKLRDGSLDRLVGIGEGIAGSFGHGFGPILCVMAMMVIKHNMAISGKPMLRREPFK